jgi:hypothetical protein
MPPSLSALREGKRCWFRVAHGLAQISLLAGFGSLACARHADAPPTPATSPPPIAVADTATPASNASPAPAPAAAAAPSSSGEPALPAHLKLGSLVLRNENGQSVLLDAKGELSVSGKNTPVGKLLPDGRFLAPDGSVKARMNEKGEFFAADGQRMPVTISDDGAVHVANGNQTLRFDATGLLVGGNANAPKTTIEGLTEETRRTAAFLLVLAAFPTRH